MAGEYRISVNGAHKKAAQAAVNSYRLPEISSDHTTIKDENKVFFEGNKAGFDRPPLADLRFLPKSRPSAISSGMKTSWRPMLHYLLLLCIVFQLRATSASAQAGEDYQILVSNEKSGDLTCINAVDLKVIATIPVGKRPRGIHASPD